MDTSRTKAFLRWMGRRNAQVFVSETPFHQRHQNQAVLDAIINDPFYGGLFNLKSGETDFLPMNMGTFNVFSYLDPALVKEEMGDPYASKTPAVWPSEASAERVGQDPLQHRREVPPASFMRMMGFSVTNPADATGAWKWLMGRAIESGLTDQAKLAGIYAANGVKHFIRDITLSLEFDVIAVDPVDRRGWILECKSTPATTRRRRLRR